MYSERDFLPCILFISLFIVYTIKAENSEPELILDGRVNIPVSILKKGLEGTIELQVYIDQKGRVESCEIIRGIAPELDSIARLSLLQSKFSPAIENGIPVPSIINIQEAFIADSLIGTFNQVEPVIEGKVLRQKDGLPVNEAQVKIIYLDTTGDPSVTSFSTYCKLIGKIPGQKYGHKSFMTITDSAGYFSFRLLPSGSIQLGITATGYQTVKDTVLINENSKINMKISMPEYLPDTSHYEITVYGKTASDNSSVSLSTQQQLFGMTHSLSNIIQNLTPVRRSSRSESEIIVRSGTPYDNLYLIHGVPFYAPYNFAGFAFGEHDGLMLSALTDINVNIDEIAGRYPSVSGALIEANPGIVRPADQRLIPRPELVIDFGNRSVDLLFSLRARKKSKRTLQLGFTGANWKLLQWMMTHYGIKEEAALGPGFPYSFGNLTLSGQYEFKNLLYEVFGWFAWDGYNASWIEEDIGLKWSCRHPVNLGVKNYFPWGMVGIGLRPSNNEKWRFFAGGSHQYFSQGKRYGPMSRLRISFLNNINTAIIFNPISEKKINIDFEGRFEHKKWSGEVIHNNFSDFIQLTYQDGKEDAFSLHSNSRLNFGNLFIKNNLLFSSRFFEGKPVLSFDPGVSVGLNVWRFLISFNAGKVTSFADFRELPDDNFRKIKLTTTVLSMPVKYRSRSFDITIQPYLRFQDLLPGTNPLLFIWDTSATTGFSAGGVETSMNYDLARWITLYSSISLSDAHRLRGEDKFTYEWKSPFSSRSGVHLNFFKEMLHLYFSWNNRSGNCYYDLSSGKYTALPTVNTHDLSIQIRYPDIKDRYYTRFNGYVTFHNLFNRTAIRDYYWNKSWKQIPIKTDGIFLTLGLKAALRF